MCLLPCHGRSGGYHWRKSLVMGLNTMSSILTTTWSLGVSGDLWLSPEWWCRMMTGVRSVGDWWIQGFVLSLRSTKFLTLGKVLYWTGYSESLKMNGRRLGLKSTVSLWTWCLWTPCVDPSAVMSIRCHHGVEWTPISCSPLRDSWWVVKMSNAFSMWCLCQVVGPSIWPSTNWYQMRCCLVTLRVEKCT